MGGLAGRWVAKLGRWVAKQGDGRLNREMGGYTGIWVAKLVARLLATATLWVRIRTFHKNTIMGVISKGFAKTL